MIDYVDLIGIPFQYGGRGPDKFDCYGLLAELEHRATGRIIPDYRSTDITAEIAVMMSNEKFRWHAYWERDNAEIVPFSMLLPGRAVLLRVKGLACHVGYIHKPRHFLHTWEGTGGVTQEKLESWRQRILGVYSYGELSPGL